MTVKEYDTDYFNWCNKQAELIKNKEFEKLDFENLVEEIESLGRSEKRAVTSYLKNLLLHLLKYRFQPMMRSRSWISSIVFSRKDFKEILNENPSLKSKLNEMIESAYSSARLKAEHETGLDSSTFPKVCCFSIDEIFDDEFYGS